MYLSALRTSITVPGLGVRISIDSLRNALCRYMFGQNCDCSQLEPYLANPRLLSSKIVDYLASLIDQAIPGINCERIDPVAFVAGALSVGAGSGGLSVDVDYSYIAQEAAKQAVCQMVKYGVKASKVLDAPAQLLAGELRKMCPAPSTSSGGVTVNNDYSLQPVPTNTSMPPLPSAVRDTNYPGKSGQSGTKSWVKPVAIVSGVALLASTVILFRKRR